MRFLFALLTIPAFAQDAGLAELAAKLGQQLENHDIASVAVLRFTSTQNYDSQLNAYLVDEINRTLAAQGLGLKVTARSQTEGALRDVGGQDYKSVAARLGVEAVIVGTFATAGQYVSVEATILDGKSGNVLGGEKGKLDRGNIGKFLGDKTATSVEPPVGTPPANIIPAGTVIDIKLTEKVDAVAARNGKTVLASLASDVVVGRDTVARKGAVVKLYATSADGLELHIELASVVLADQRTVTANSEPLTRAAGSDRTKGALSGVLGGIANGGTVGLPSGAPAKPKAAEFGKDTQLSLRLTKDVR